MNEQLKAMIGKNETIYYEGKPDKKTFVLESIFNPLLPFALIWGHLICLCFQHRFKKTRRFM